MPSGPDPVPGIKIRCIEVLHQRVDLSFVFLAPYYPAAANLADPIADCEPYAAGGAITHSNKPPCGTRLKSGWPGRPRKTGRRPLRHPHVELKTQLGAG
jgi:hypothetical protein